MRFSIFQMIVFAIILSSVFYNTQKNNELAIDLFENMLL